MQFNTDSANAFISFVRGIYGDQFVTLHHPVFEGNERKYLVECIDSNFVSSVGAKVTEFERHVAEFTGASYAVATVNGTAALHLSLDLVGVQPGDEVITQALTFVATCSATSYCGATPVFIDVDLDTLGLSPEALRRWLMSNVVISDGASINKTTGARIAACVPMHTFGIPCRIAQIVEVCKEFGIPVVEDAAESLGSYIGKRHTGTYGDLGTFSFNGNKIVTTGGGGMIVTNDQALAARARHLTTTAKVPHPYEFVHDEIGYNYRLPNLNAALGCAQMEKLPVMLAIKAELAKQYQDFCERHGFRFILPPEGTSPNHWLNAIVLDDADQRDAFLKFSNSEGVMTRPVWRLMSSLAMFNSCQSDELVNSKWIENRLVNLPSSVPGSEYERIRKWMY
jgi:perosamine synthetase